MLDRYERFVAPGAALADEVATARIWARWELTLPEGARYAGPSLLVAGRQDSTVGYAATVDLLDAYPRATLAVLDGAGHALPHEQPTALAGLLAGWLAACGV
jgi:pimeloyl-ACP methyl ester carboxylesterase